MIKNNCHLVTGAVGTGKSTVLAGLHKTVGVIPEVAREIIEKEIATGGRGLPWIHFPTFEQTVHAKNIERFMATPEKGVWLSDRGIPDAIAFYRWYGEEVPDEIISDSQKFRYAPTVFFFPPWKEIYLKDEVRPTSFTEALRLSRILQEVFDYLGYQLLEVPIGPVAERVAFVKAHLDSLHGPEGLWPQE